MSAESKKGISANQLKRTLAVSWHTRSLVRTAILGASSHSDAAGTPSAEGFDLAFWVGWYTMYHRTVSRITAFGRRSTVEQANRIAKDSG